MMSWKTFLARAAIGSAMVGVAVFAGVRLAAADPGGPTSNGLTFAGVLRERAGSSGNTLTFAFHKGSAATLACTATTLPFAIDANGAFSVLVPLDGCADPRGLFDGDSVAYDVRLGGATGDLLASNVAVTPVPYARFADQAGVSNDCPVGYTRDTDANVPAGRWFCRHALAGGGVDQVVRVGDGASAFWIDRFEASAWANGDGSGAQYGAGADRNDYPATFPRNGQWRQRVYALSRTGVAPSVNLTWFQALEACRASGKRLPTGSEWLSAAKGTADPGASPGTSGLCNTMSGSARTTGGGTLCRSDWGAQEMIGNVWEWTDEWYASVGQVNALTATSGGEVIGRRVNDGLDRWGAGFGGDGTWNVAATVSSNALDNVTGIPAAALRGGDWGAGVLGGVLSLYLDFGPMGSHANVGFRCVLPR